jgi:acyl-CoA reductase-like NAD-dependent aldehyde dehydrogenase
MTSLPPEMLTRVNALALPGLAVIDGAQVEARSGATFHNVSPRDGVVLNAVAACQAEDVERAVASARRRSKTAAGVTRDRARRRRSCSVSLS